MKTAIKERPILFSSPMVRALLAGQKTQTRRQVKPQPTLLHRIAYEHTDGTVACACSDHPQLSHGAKMDCVWCPYGKTGDRLWVRETFYIDNFDYMGPLPKEKPGDLGDYLYYRADGECCDQIPECACSEVGKPRWRPSIFMPRWASRITLEITGVKVERLNDISRTDAEEEGFTETEWDSAGRTMVNSPGTNFRYLWEKINGKGSWDANPWVWAVSFRRAEVAS